MRLDALIPGFADELTKIAHQKKAMVGAALGGAAGFAMGGNTVQSRAANTLVGAGLGHLAGKVFRGTKKQVWNEPRERSERDLYGYQPSTVTEPAENFVQG